MPTFSHSATIHMSNEDVTYCHESTGRGTCQNCKTRKTKISNGHTFIKFYSEEIKIGDKIDTGIVSTKPVVSQKMYRRMLFQMKLLQKL